MLEQLYRRRHAKKSNCAYGRRLWLMLAAMCHVGLKSFRFFFTPLIQVQLQHLLIYRLTPTPHTHTILTPHIHKQTYNYTQITISRPFKQRTARAHTEIISYIYKVHHAMDSLFSLALYGEVYHVSQLRREMWTNWRKLVRMSDMCSRLPHAWSIVLEKAITGMDDI